MLNYKAIEIFTSEEARYRKKPVADAVMRYIRLSFNMPIRIYIILPAGGPATVPIRNRRRGGHDH